MTEDGTSGAYILRNQDKKGVAIFKAIDEEPFAPNNPRSHSGPFGSQTFRPGVLSGESCIREVAAYLLDHKNFSNVPETTFVEIVHNALKFVPFTGLEVTSDYYYDVLSTLITPVNNDEGPQSKTKRNDTSKGNDLTISNRSMQKRSSIDTRTGPKFGSLQIFCENIGAVENYSSDKFSKDDVHKIAILDLRLLNLDRND